MRALSELVDVDESAWPALQEEFARSGVPVRVLPAERPRRGRSCLLQLQLTVRSALGAVALHSGGLLVDSGWVRIFGGAGPDAHDALPSLARVNGFPADPEPGWRPEGGLVVAHDVLGGVFAINGPEAEGLGRPGDPGEIAYFGPDTLEWEPLEVGHGAWLSWVLGGGLEHFYRGLRWPGWREEVVGVAPSHGIVVEPCLWSAHAQGGIADACRRPVPTAELVGLYRSETARLGLAGPGFLGHHADGRPPPD
ncbi:hypothetical protein LP52_22880 [Streptomonospora alba]|uniref:DUF2625 domain-containing protein n=1 Tax=Streptomonospora alba TaxID=183763 RepID=A0A0C2JIM4_9ACTN|nr:DUF2625 family protein [Streptomonospora alba]KIH96782.1 hypothetical protein LP52_22880 [Streptomonospora alba]